MQNYADSLNSGSSVSVDKLKLEKLWKNWENEKKIILLFSFFILLNLLFSILLFRKTSHKLL
jgi:hypothetical protein